LLIARAETTVKRPPDMPSVTDWAGVAVAAGGFFYAGRQLRLAQRAARGSFLLNIQEALRHHDPVHRRLDADDGPDWNPGERSNELPLEWADVEAYMGVFERVQLLVQQRSLDLDTVDQLYSFRLINLTRNRHIHRAKLEEKGMFWGQLITLWRNLEQCPVWQRNVEYLQAKGLTVPPPAPPSDDHRRLAGLRRRIGLRVMP
jgi:hypothetical protein